MPAGTRRRWAHALVCITAILVAAPAKATTDGSEMAGGPVPPEVRWLGHEHVIDLAERGTAQLTIGSEGLAILWEAGAAVAWQRVPNARFAVPAADATWWVVGESQAWRFDATLSHLVEQSAAARATRCVGAPIVWWWDDATLRVEDGRTGADRRSEIAMPETAARCSVTPDGAALTWFTERGAAVAAFDGAQLSLTEHAFSSDANPVALPAREADAGLAWTVVPRLGALIRSCDLFTSTGAPVPCPRPIEASADATLPRVLEVLSWVRTATHLYAVDAAGWSYLGDAGGGRVAPTGWRTYGVLEAADQIVGCRTTAEDATLETRTTTGELVASFRLPTGACPDTAWVDGQRAAVTAMDAVLDWLPEQRRWQSHARGQAVASSAPFGALQTRLQVREDWSPMCGAHRTVWRLSGVTEEPLELGVACADFSGLSPILANGELVGAEVIGERSGTVALNLDPATTDAADAPMPWTERLVVTTAGWFVEVEDGVWMSEPLRRFAVVIADGEVAAGRAVTTSPAWAQDAPRTLRAQASLPGVAGTPGRNYP